MMSGFKQNSRYTRDLVAFGEVFVDAVTQRRYLAGAPYLLPRDADESSRLDFQHFAFRSALGSNHFAPLSRLQTFRTCLDVGCGTTVWAQDLCREFPDLDVWAFDIDSPERSGTPERCHFIQGDLLQGINLDAASFDYVHQRFMSLAIPAANWLPVMQDLTRLTRSGGFVELVELGIDHVNPAGPITAQLFDDLRDIAHSRNMNLRAVSSLDTLMSQAGLVNIRKRAYALPVGRWGGRVGSLMRTNLQALMSAFKEFYVRTLHYSPTYFDDLLTPMAKELETYQSRYPIYVYYGQKP